MWKADWCTDDRAKGKLGKRGSESGLFKMYHCERGREGHGIEGKGF